MNWFNIIKYQNWRDVKPQPIENQETKEGTIAWIRKNRSITLNGHRNVNSRINTVNEINNEKFPFIFPFEPIKHPLLTDTNPSLHPRRLVDETTREIEKHNERTISLIRWIGSDENTHRIVIGDLT